MNHKIHFLITALAAAAFCLSVPSARAGSAAEEAAKTAKAKDKAAADAEEAAEKAQKEADAAEKKDAEKKGKDWKKSDADKAADEAAKKADEAAKAADDAKDKAEKAKEDADAAKKDSDNAGSDKEKKDKAKKAAEEAAAAAAAAAAAENGYPPAPKSGPGSGLPGGGGTSSGATGSNGKPGSGGAEGASKAADDKAEAADKSKAGTDDREVQRLKKEAREARRKARAARRAARKALRDLAALIADELSKTGKAGTPPPSPLKDPIKDLEELKKKLGADNLPVPPGSGTQLAQLMDGGSVTVAVSGTGETIGHVADVTLKNLTAQPLNVSIPPTLLIPGSGNYQPYALTGSHGATVGAGQTATIPLEGICLDARKPPVTPDDTVGLTIADPGTLPQPLRDQLAGAQRVMTTARALQAAGKFKTPYSGNPGKELDTIVQWTTWAGVARMTGNPLTKADFADKVYEQAGLPIVADGLVRAGFTVPQGKIKVYLPANMAAGDTISGTVVAEPKGTSAAERKKNAETLNGYVIEVAGQKGPVSARMLTGVVPGSFTANPTLVLADAKGTTVKSISIPQPSKSAAKKAEAPATSDFQLPTIGQAGRPLEITGPFDGNASNTNVTIGGQELPILAESASRTIVQAPNALAGPAELVVKEGGRDVKGTYANKTAAEVVSAPKTSAPKSHPTGPMQQKLDKGIDDLWSAIQLTGKEAKVL